MVKGSISRWVAEELMLASYIAMLESSSSLTSRYSMRPRERKSSKPSLPLRKAWRDLAVTLDLPFSTTIRGRHILPSSVAICTDRWWPFNDMLTNSETRPARRIRRKALMKFLGCLVSAVGVPLMKMI